jgi:hypothetical protein
MILSSGEALIRNQRVTKSGRRLQFSSGNVDTSVSSPNKVVRRVTHGYQSAGFRWSSLAET